MGPPSYRCCQTVYVHGRFMHPCKMSPAERDEINNPEDYPGIEWRREAYKDGRKWRRVIKPIYGCSNAEFRAGECSCAFRKHIRDEINLDQFYPTVEVKFDSVDAAMQAEARRRAMEYHAHELKRMHVVPPFDKLEPEIPWWQPFRRMLLNWHTNRELVKAQEKEELIKRAEKLYNESACKAFDFIWDNRDVHTAWKHKYPKELIDEKHPIIRLLEDRYDWVYNGEIPVSIKRLVWNDFLGQITFTAGDSGLYNRMCRKMISELGDIMERAREERTYNESLAIAREHEAKMNPKYVSVRRIDGEWTIDIGGLVTPVRLGGRPSTVDLIVEPFYRFDAEGFCSLTIERGSINPVRVRFNESYEIVDVKRSDTNEVLDGFSVLEGHVLLDMLMVHVPVSRALNGNQSKTR